MAEPKALDDLVLWNDNYNKGDVDAIALSIRKFGFNNAPRIWRNNQVRGGNHSVMAIRRLRDEGPNEDIDKAWPPQNVIIKDGQWYLQCVDIAHLSRIEADAFAIADNELARQSTRDEALLLAYLKDIGQQDAIMLKATGFDDDALKDLTNLVARQEHEALKALTEAGEKESRSDDQPDRGAELQAAWQVQPGDLWRIPSRSGQGYHYLMCGDATDKGAVKRLCAGNVAGVFTSPPYAEQRNHTYGGIPADTYVTWWADVQAATTPVLDDDGSFFVNIKPHVEDGARHLYVADLVLAMCREWGWQLIDEHCWLRNGSPGSWPNRFKNNFEPVYQFARQVKIKFYPHHVARSEQGSSSTSNQNNAAYYNTTDIKWDYVFPSNVRELKHTAEGLGHSAAFPVSLPDFFVRAYSNPGDRWYDPFCGSGTTIVAAEQTKRLAAGMELLPENCAIILQRMKDLGLEPSKVEAVTDG